jgi:hypothetical protein
VGDGPVALRTAGGLDLVEPLPLEDRRLAERPAPELDVVVDRQDAGDTLAGGRRAGRDEAALGEEQRAE